MDKFDVLVDRRTINRHTFISSITSKAVFNGFASDFIFINHDIIKDFINQWRHMFFNMVGIHHEVEFIITSF